MTSKKSSRLKSTEDSGSSRRRSTQSSREADLWLRMRSLPVIGLPPMCECGCGERVESYIHGKKWRWRRFLPRHQYRVHRPQSEKQKRTASERMKRDNPMWDPKVARQVGQKVSARWREHGDPRTPEGIRNIRDAARRRMLSSANPMKDPETARKVHRQNLAKATPTFTERWIMEMDPTLRWTGDGSLWIGNRNPDFEADPGRVIETCQKGFFNSGVMVQRTPEGYGIASIRHYRSHSRECLVVFLPSHRRKTEAVGASRAISWFKAAERSGVYSGGRLFEYDAASDSLASTT